MQASKNITRIVQKFESLCKNGQKGDPLSPNLFNRVLEEVLRKTSWVNETGINII